LLIMLIPTVLTAQNKQDNKPTKMNQERWEKEMRQYKNDFIVKSLDITDAQKAKFLPLYNKMEDELRCLNQQTMSLARSVRDKGEAATDLEKEKAAEAQFELKVKEGTIEMKYFKEFRSILSPSQLLKLKGAERNFSRQLMNHNRERHAKSAPKSKRPATATRKAPAQGTEK
ncbi:MAG: Spy/CpxP family protein refolding chaperone, partial [Duncaniella sp.]|nr:Spy/CpxP family protein refolding chaperone [Duncaniella sp.]